MVSNIGELQQTVNLIGDKLGAPKETLKKTSISGEIHASHELNG